MAKMTLSEELKWRGFVNQTTLADISSLDKKPQKFYMGFDASADSQTIGNLAGMMFAKTFLRHGHDGYLLAGGSTSLIGDPGGKDKERPLQSEETIDRNISQAKKQLADIFKDQKITIVNNLDWTKDLKVLPFLRDIGKHFSMTPLIQRDYIASRLGQKGSGISYAEFSYTILQGYDFLHLYDKHGVTLQLGGSDQWGNCLSGVELIRKARGAEVNVVTLNLVINQATGKKFGKTEDGAVWLDPAKTNPDQFYQFWLNADDAGVEGYLKIYTELDKDQIDDVMRQFKANPAERAAQKLLAKEVTTLVHGQDAAKHAEAAAGVLRSTDIDANDVAKLRQSLPVKKIKSGTTVISALVESELAGSNSEALRFLAQGGVYLNNQKLNKDAQITSKDVKSGYVLLRRGKNNCVLLELD